MNNDDGRSQKGLPVRLDDHAVLRYSGTSVNVANPSVNISLFRGGFIVVSGLSTETLTIRGRIDHDSSPLDSDPILVQRTDGTTVAAAALGNGTYYFDVMFERLIIIKSGGANNVGVGVYLRT